MKDYLFRDRRSCVSIHSFALQSKVETDFISISTTEGQTTLLNAVDGLQFVTTFPDYLTNWEAGIRGVIPAPVGGFIPNFVYFVTDGLPTTRVTGCDPMHQPCDGLVENLEQARLASVVLQQQGAVIIPIGVGSSVTDDALKTIAGPCFGDNCQLNWNFYHITQFSRLLQPLVRSFEKDLKLTDETGARIETTTVAEVTTTTDTTTTTTTETESPTTTTHEEYPTPTPNPSFAPIPPAHGQQYPPLTHHQGHPPLNTHKPMAGKDVVVEPVPAPTHVHPPVNPGHTYPYVPTTRPTASRKKIQGYGYPTRSSNTRYPQTAKERQQYQQHQQKMIEERKPSTPSPLVLVTSTPEVERTSVVLIILLSVFGGIIVFAILFATCYMFGGCGNKVPASTIEERRLLSNQISVQDIEQQQQQQQQFIPQQQQINAAVGNYMGLDGRGNLISGKIASHSSGRAGSSTFLYGGGRKYH